MYWIKKRKVVTWGPFTFFFLFLKRLSQDNVTHVPTPQTSHVQNEASTHFISKPWGLQSHKGTLTDYDDTLTKSFLIKQMCIKGAAKLKIWLLSDIKTHQLTMCIGHWLPGKEPPWNGSEHLHVHTLWWWMRPWVNESDILHLSIPLCHYESLCTDGDKTSSLTPRNALQGTTHRQLIWAETLLWLLTSIHCTYCIVAILMYFLTR